MLRSYGDMSALSSLSRAVRLQTILLKVVFRSEIRVQSRYNQPDLSPVSLEECIENKVFRKTSVRFHGPPSR